MIPPKKPKLTHAQLRTTLNQFLHRLIFIQPSQTHTHTRRRTFSHYSIYDPTHHFLTRHLFHHTPPRMARPIKNMHFLPNFYPQDMQGMMRLLITQHHP